MVLVEDFLQLPPVIQKSMLMNPSKRSYKSFNRWLWETFQLRELVENIRQSSDTSFPQLLNRVSEGQ